MKLQPKEHQTIAIVDAFEKPEQHPSRAQGDDLDVVLRDGLRSACPAQHDLYRAWAALRARIAEGIGP